MFALAHQAHNVICNLNLKYIFFLVKFSTKLHVSSKLNDLYLHLGLKTSLRIKIFIAYSLNLLFNYFNCNSKYIKNISADSIVITDIFTAVAIEIIDLVSMQ
jgi:hypothetical protein